MTETLCFFVSDLHGKPDRYRKLFQEVYREKPDAVILRRRPAPSPDEKSRKF